MKPLAALLTVFLGFIPAVTADSFVFRVCFTTEDADVTLRETEDKKGAEMCAWVVTCESAEVKVKIDPAAKRSFWRSYSPERCKR